MPQRRLRMCLLLALVFSGCAPAAELPTREARTVTPSFEPVAEAMAQAIRAEMDQHRLPALSIALVADGSIVWAEAFGSVAVGPDAAERRPADLDTVYRVGSVSKLFTDIAIMQLVESGDVDLDAPVTAYLPEFAPIDPFGKPITLRQLMSHRSGLVREPPVGNYFDDNEPSIAATVKSLNATTLVYEPEARQKYSNAGITVVGYALEQLAGEPFAAVLQQRVLAPLGMDSSSFVPTAGVREHLADALMWAVDGREFTAPTFELGMAPAGSMYSTVADLSRFMIAMMVEGEGRGASVLEPGTLAQMWTPQFAAPDATTGFGIGFGLSRLDGQLRVGHGGAIYGFATELAMLPDAGLGVVVTTTRDFANRVTTHLANATLRAALAHRAGETIPLPATVPPLFSGMAASLAGRARTAADGTEIRRAAELPDSAPPHLAGLVGEYGWDYDVLFILERQGQLVALIEWFEAYPLEDLGGDRFRFPAGGLYDNELLVFERDADGNATAAIVGVPPGGASTVPGGSGSDAEGDWGVRFQRRAVGTPSGETFKIDPVRPAEDLRVEALAAEPPAETPPEGGFRAPELVELNALDATIGLDIRYATTNNFMGAVFYDQARAFMQRPAAEALVRAHQALAAQGFGLLIHDAYRPWYVTKMFWDATPEDKKQFVANPANGSRHNRGSAVDLTLYELATGEPVEMVGGYDEFTERSYPDYPGGTARQRWLRELLRERMEEQGFAVYEFEWWHFDHQDWRRYPILNLTFDRIGQPPDVR